MLRSPLVTASSACRPEIGSVKQSNSRRLCALLSTSRAHGTDHPHRPDERQEIPPPHVIHHRSLRGGSISSSKGIAHRSLAEPMPTFSLLMPRWILRGTRRRRTKDDGKLSTFPSASTNSLAPAPQAFARSLR